MYWTKEKDERLRAAIIVYKKTNDRHIAGLIIKTITPIVEGKLNAVYRKYYNLPPKEDIRQEVLMQCCLSLSNFNPCFRTSSGQLVKVYSFLTKTIQNRICRLLKNQIGLSGKSAEFNEENISSSAYDLDIEIIDKIIVFIESNHPSYLNIANNLKQHIIDNGKLFLREFKRDYQYQRINRFFSLLRRNKSFFDKLQ